jgi:hypothetical protein
MSAVLEPIAGGNSLSRRLDRVRTLRVAPGATVHRPLPDVDEPEEDDHRPGALMREEAKALKEACKPLAAHEKAMQEARAAAIGARHSLNPAERAKHPALTEQIATLEAERPALVGSARLAILGAVEAATTRAGAEYRTACRMAGDAAAQLEGLATLRDELLGRNDFDALGTWQRCSALLAPPVGYRPRGWTVVPDAFGRECYWHPTGPAHRDAVRRAKTEFRQQAEKHMAGASWPFEG